MFLSGVAFSLVGIASAITAPSWGRFGQEHGFYKALCAATLLSGLMSAVTAMPQYTAFGSVSVIFAMACAVPVFSLR